MADTKTSSAGKDAADKDASKDMDEIIERETWGNKFDFLLACVGFSVGLGNVWRFPYLCYKNGGGAFLIPYMICVIVGGIPLFFLEVSVGQFMGVAGINAWNICPLFRGIGLSTLCIVFFLNCYYNVILAWAFRYLFASLTSKLPWAECDYDDWATEHCTNFKDARPVDNRCILNSTTGTNVTGVKVEDRCETLAYAAANNISVYNASGDVRILSYYVEPVTEYWENKVLAISEGVDEMGPVKWDLVLCLLLAWIVVYSCICKGIKSSGKVMYVTATTPYLFMLILLIRNCLLDGAGDGILYYIKPDFNKMKEMAVWVDAGTQIFFSYSIAVGALTVLGSYNKFHHNSYRDCVIFALTNSGTSIFAGFIIFSILGHMAYIQDKPISEVAESGPGLAFIAYPKALALMPGAPFWSVMFFIMIILLGLDSQFVGVEGVVTAIVDQFPTYLRKGHRREIFIGFVCILQFLVGMPMVTPGGMYVFQLFDYYSGSRIILFVAAFMCIAVAWLYGVQRFYDNLEMMYGFRINPYMKICWTVLSPVFCMVIFILSTINYSELYYDRPKGRYVYPNWAVGIGWTMAAFAAVWIPLGWIYHVIKYGGDMETFKRTIRPRCLKDHQMRPQDYGEETIDNINASRYIYGVEEAPPAYTSAAPIEDKKAGLVNMAYSEEKSGSQETGSTSDTGSSILYTTNL